MFTLSVKIKQLKESKSRKNEEMFFDHFIFERERENYAKKNYKRVNYNDHMRLFKNFFFSFYSNFFAQMGFF